MRVHWLLLALLLVFGLLQYRLWFAQGSLAEQHRLQRQAREQAQANEGLRERNAVLEREVLELQNGVQGIEQRAREELGLVKEGEIFFHLVEKRGGEGDKASPGRQP